MIVIIFINYLIARQMPKEPWQDNLLFARIRITRAILKLLEADESAAYQSVCEHFGSEADAERALLYEFFYINPKFAKNI